MNGRISIEISSRRLSYRDHCASLLLPANREQIEDALARARIQPDEEYQVMLDFCDVPCLRHLLPKELDLQEVNFLATLLGDMILPSNLVFAGMVAVEVRDTGCQTIPLLRLIQFARSVKWSSIYPASNAKELGEFLLENNMLELVGISDVEKLPVEVQNALDAEKLGQQYCAITKGVFVQNGFFEPSALPPALTHAEIPEPESCGYVFSFDCDGAATVRLPCKPEQLAAEMLRLKGYQQGVLQYSCSLRGLHKLNIQIENLAKANQLASMVLELREQGALTRYKALLKATEVVDLNHALKLIEELEDYQLFPDYLGAGDYARQVLDAFDLPEKESLFETADLDEYGCVLMDAQNLCATSYGFLKRKDGGPILSYQPEPQATPQLSI